MALNSVGHMGMSIPVEQNGAFIAFTQVLVLHSGGSI
jgi:hypothetical protein